MKLTILLVSLLGFCLQNCVVSGLRFDIQNPIQVDSPNGVIEIGKRTKLTCSYMTSRSDSIKAIRWYISYKASNNHFGNVFTYNVDTGKKENLANGFSHFKVFAHTASKKDLEIKLNDFKESPVTIKCEVETGRGNKVSREKDINVVEQQSVQPRDPRNHDVHEDIHELMDLIDPRKHMHAGIPYDFHNGYILMVGNNFDTRHQSTHLYGQLPTDVIRELQTNHPRQFQLVANKKYKIDINPVDILNILGSHNYRVIGFAAQDSQKMVWTLEERNFGNVQNVQNSNSQHQSHNIGFPEY